MELESKKKFIVDVLFIVTIAAVIYFVIKYLLGWFIPLIVGMIIVMVMQPLSKLIARIVPIKNKTASFTALLLFYILIGVLIWLGSAAIISQCSDFIPKLPGIYQKYFVPLMLSFNDWAIGLAQRFSPGAAESISELLGSLVSEITNIISNFSVTALNSVTDTVKNLPMYLITLVFTIVCSVFIALNYPAVKAFIYRQLPDKGKEMMSSLKVFLTGKLVKVLKAYSIIMVITFVENAVGLSILRVENSVAIAAIIAVCDIVPLLGSGTILIPWALFKLFSLDFFTGFGLLILYAVIAVVRNMIEPKIVGSQIGLNPIVTISAMYAGLKIFGFVGFFIGPLAVLFLIQLHNDGYIKIWK